MKISTDVSNAFYALKGIAIITVVYAHCIFENMTLHYLSSLIGIIGVRIFLIVSGCFFNPNVEWNTFFRRIVKRLVIPWLLYGNGTYLLYLLASQNAFEISELLKWILGYKTWLYYVPVLILCMLITKVFYNKRYYVCVSIVISLISIEFTRLHLITSDYFTEYQNVFNWIGFFALGGYLKKRRILEFHPNKLQRYKWWLSGFCILGVGLAFVLMNMHYENEISYFSICAVVFELCIFVFLYLLSFYCRNSKLLVYFGKNSYPIYFLHMQVGLNVFEILERLTKMNELVAFVLKPSIVVLMIAIGILIVSKVLKLMKIEKVLEIIAFA